MQCEKCKTEMVAVTKQNSVSALGIIGVFIFLVGLGFAFANILVGIIIMALGIFVGMAKRGEKLTMTCPRCGHKTDPVSI